MPTTNSARYDSLAARLNQLLPDQWVRLPIEEVRGKSAKQRSSVLGRAMGIRGLNTQIRSDAAHVYIRLRPIAPDLKDFTVVAPKGGDDE